MSQEAKGSEAPLRIALDGRALTGRFTGDRTYWRSLIRALLEIDSENAYHVYTRTPIPDGELPNAPNLTAYVIEAGNDRLWTLFSFPQALRRDGADIVHVQYTAPPKSPCPIITTVHDISFRLYPQWFPLRHRLLLNMTVPGSMRRAARILTVSESSRRDILRVYGLPPEKVIATPLGVAQDFALYTEDRAEAQAFVRERFGLEKPFVLSVGVLQPRKNLPTLAQAFGQAVTRYGLPHQLVITGKAGWGTARENLIACVTRGGASPDTLVFTDYVEDAELPRLYRACAAFAYPSLYEGFGLPPLEAMACGAAVLVSDAPPMPEIAGGAALVVPAADIEAWTEALGRVLRDDDLRRKLAALGPERARQFTWNETAQRTLNVYREAAVKT